jgi:hypothetical protein
MSPPLEAMPDVVWLSDFNAMLDAVLPVVAPFVVALLVVGVPELSSEEEQPVSKASPISRAASDDTI